MLAVGLWIVLGGYTLTYWGYFMMQGEHVPMECLAFGSNC